MAKDELRDIRANLLSPGIGPGTYADGGERYQTALMEQYKLCVEMADRISQRRGLTNMFFLTLNSAIFTLIGIFWNKQPEVPEWTLVFPALLAVLECVAWWLLIRSYRQLNTAKYKVIGALEEQLPASPFWKAEWPELGEGKTIRLYYPLSHIEGWIPMLFILAYLVGWVLAIRIGSR